MAFSRFQYVLTSRKVNCVTELLPQRALARADELDEYLAKYKRPMGPLHGLPISVKEIMAMKDLGYNAGFAAWVGKTASDDALILNILLKAGGRKGRECFPFKLKRFKSSKGVISKWRFAKDMLKAVGAW